MVENFAWYGKFVWLGSFSCILHGNLYGMVHCMVWCAVWHGCIIHVKLVMSYRFVKMEYVL